MIIAQGAEAIIRKEGNKIVKERVKKGYRLDLIDEKLRKIRTRKETKLLGKSYNLIPVPRVISSDEIKKEIVMDYIDGKKLSMSLDKIKDYTCVCEKIGQNIAKLHDNGIIHGDLTTSNMILKGKEVFFIDFGLGFESQNVEDKAVDLHLIKEALEARHFRRFKEYFSAVVKGYGISRWAKEVLRRLEKVEQRGRYKQAY